MKRISRYVIYITFFMMLFVSFYTTNVLAADNGSGTNTHTESGVNGGYVEGNPSVTKVGYLVYLTDAGGNLVPGKPIVLVPFDSAPSPSVDVSGIRTRLTGTPYTGTYSGTLSKATNGKFTKPPYSIDGYEGGAEFKNTMLEQDESGVANGYYFINNVFGPGTDEVFKANDWRCVCEAVGWSNLKSGEDDLYAYTSKTSAELIIHKEMQESTSWKKLFKMRIPRSNFLERSKPMAGLTPPQDLGYDMDNSSIPFDDLTRGEVGFGTVVLGPGDTIVTQDPVEYDTTDYLRANELN